MIHSHIAFVKGMKITRVSRASLILMILCSITLVAQTPVNQAMSLNGNSQWMEIPDNPKIAIPVFTAECWIKVQGSGLIVTRDVSNGTPSDWQLWYDHSQRRLAFITAKTPPDQYFYTPPNSITPNQWTHVAIVANGPAGYAYVYIDGNLSISPTFTSRYFDGVTGLAWAGYYNNPLGGYLKGQMDEARYWNIERTPAQLQNAKDKLLPMNDRQGLVGYWMFCSNFADSSGYGHNGVPRGNPQIVDVFDLPLGLACGVSIPEIIGYPLNFRAIVCASESTRDSIVWIRNTGNGLLTIFSARIGGPDSLDFRIISPIIPPTIEISPGDSIPFRIQFAPTNSGTRSAFLVVQSNAGNDPTYQIALTGRKEIISFTVSPQLIQFDQNLTSQFPKSISLVVRNTGAVPITITKNSFTIGTGYRLVNFTPFTLTPGQERGVTIQFDSTIVGVYQSILTLRSTPCDTLFSIPVAGSITTQIPFQRLRCENDLSLDTTIVVHNFTDRPLKFYSYNFNGTNPSEFELVNPPSMPPEVIVAPGDSTRFTIRYRPKSAGYHNATLSLNYESMVNGSLDIALGGRKDSISTRLSSTTIDFGKKQSSELPARYFLLVENNGTQTIIVRQILLSPADTFKVITQLPRSIPPGGSDSIWFEFSPSSNGIFHATAEITISPCDKKFLIDLQGMKLRLPLISATPANFGVLQCLGEASRDTVIIVRNSGDAPLRISSAQIIGPDAADFSLIFPPIIPPEITIAPQDSMYFQVRFYPTSPGNRSATLMLETNSASTSSYGIPLIGKKELSAITLSATFLDFNNNQPGELPKDLLIIITNSGTIDRTIVGASITPFGPFTLLTNIPLLLRAGSSQPIIVRFNPSSNGIFQAELEFRLTPCDTTMKIRLNGARSTLPYISAAPIDVQALICAFETARDTFIVVRNSGNDTLILSEARIDGVDKDEFELLTQIPPEMRLASRDSIKLMLRFTPRSIGLKQAFIRVVSNAVNAPAFNTPVIGRKALIDLRASIQEIDIGILCPNERRDSSFTIRNVGTIASLAFVDSDIPIIPTPTSMMIDTVQSNRIDFTFPGVGQQGIYRGKIRIHDQCNVIETVYVRAEIVSPNFAVDPLVLPTSTGTPVDGNLTIRNTGRRSITITQWSVDDPRFVILAPLLPQVIDSGRSLSVQVRFTPIDTSTVQTIFRVRAEPCSLEDQTTIVASASSRRSVSVTTPSHGTIRCPLYRDTTIIISNTNVLPVTVSRITITGVHATDFFLINPVSIPPSQSILPRQRLEIVVRFLPLAEGMRSAQLEIMSDATDTPSVIVQLTGRKENARVAVSDTLVNFGVLCPAEIKSQTIMVSNTGSVSQNLRISINTPYAIPVNTMQIDPGETKSVDVQFAGSMLDGLHSGILLIEAECNIQHRVVFEAIVETPGLTADSLSFFCLLGDSETRDVLLRNKTNRAITVTRFLLARPELTILSPSLPQVIPAGGEIFVRVRFIPVDTLRMTTLLNAFTQPCDLTSQAWIDVQAVEATATVAFPIMAAGVDTLISIPIHLVNASYLQKSGATSFTTRVRFNRSMLYPVGVHTEHPNASVRITNNRRDGNDRVLDLEVIDTATPSTGILVYLDCKTALGNSEKTPLVIEQFDWQSARVRTLRIDGEYSTLGICEAGGKRLLQQENTFQLHQNYPNPFSRSTTIRLVIRDWRLESTAHNTLIPNPRSLISFKVFDLFGREVLDLSDEANNKSQITILKSQIPAPGMYFYRLTVGAQSHTKMMVILK